MSDTAHTWYHDGGRSETKDGYDRLCTRCRFREKVIQDVPCFGDGKIHDAAMSEGFSAGIRAERDRLKNVLGIH